MSGDPVVTPLTMSAEHWNLLAYAYRESFQAAPEGALSPDALALFVEVDALRAKLAEAQRSADAYARFHDDERAEHNATRDALTAAQDDKARVTRLLEVAEATIAQLGDKLEAAQATIKALMDTVAIVLDADAVSPNAAEALDGALQSACAALASRPSDANAEGVQS